MKTYPLKRLSLEQATELQFRLVDAIHREFDGREIVQDGDHGHSLRPDLGRPLYTAKVEAVLEAFFDLPRVALVRGGGTSALRSIIMSALRPAGSVLVHDAPLYPTTRETFAAMGALVGTADFNDTDALAAAMRAQPELLHVQHARHLLADRYDLADVLSTARSVSPATFVMVDDSYAVCRAPAIGAQLGADVSGFSFFKLLGPSVGCVAAGSPRGVALIDRIRQLNKSGGQRVPGPEAMEILRGLVLAPVALAVQGGVVEQVAARLQARECAGVQGAWAANCNSYAVFVELEEPIAAQVLDIAQTLGAQRQVVGSESRLEMAALIHEPFHYFAGAGDVGAVIGSDRWLRINPHRAGPDTIIRILSEAIAAVRDRSGPGTAGRSSMKPSQREETA